MKSIDIKFGCTLLVFLMASSPLQASESILSLYQAALSYDAQYKSTVANANADKEEIEKARALFFPKVQLSGSLGRGNTDRTTQSLSGGIDSHLNYNTQNLAITVKQPLFNKETIATYRSAQALVKSKEYVLESEDSSLITRIANAYFELLYAEERADVAESQIIALGQQLEQANKRFEHGTGTITELSEAQASLAIAEADLLEAKNSIKTFQLALSNMSGHEVNEVAKLNTEKVLNLDVNAVTMDNWLKIALDSNPEIIAAKYALEVAQQEVEKKQSGHYPTLDLVGARSYSENDSNNTLGSKFDSTTLALQVNMPLFAGGYVSASVRQAMDRVDAAREELNFKTIEVSANIKKNFQQMQSGKLSIQAYQQAVKSSEVALDGTSKSFVGGLRTNIDVLNAQQKLYENRLKLSKSYYMVINSVVNIKHDAGMLNAEQLRELNQYFVMN